jgi:hypothetical protein
VENGDSHNPVIIGRSIRRKDRKVICSRRHRPSASGESSSVPSP